LHAPNAAHPCIPSYTHSQYPDALQFSPQVLPLLNVYAASKQTSWPKEQDAIMAYDAIHLLLVATDSDSTKLFLREIQPHRAFPCTHATSASETLDRLRGAAGYALFPHPYILLIDLDAPELDPQGCLKTLRQDPALRPSLVWGLADTLDSQAVLDTRDFGVTFWLLKSTIATNFAPFLALLDAYRFQQFPPDRR
jgi:CheY-like chemotaxis protein